MLQKCWWSFAALTLFACRSNPTQNCPGLAACGDFCVDLMSNRDHCGTCGNECFAGQTCEAGVCHACQNECMLGVQSCAQDGKQILLCDDLDEDTCLEWWPNGECGPGTHCEDAKCLTDCQDPCGPAGARVCDLGGGNGYQVCSDPGDGCLRWGSLVACQANEVCVDGTCEGRGPFYKNITILDSKVVGSGSHADFPVLISLVDSDLHDNCASDGSDIAFFSGTLLLDFEIESFDLNYTASEARLVAWVRMPSLSASSDTIIKMVYGLPPGSYQNATGVWNNHYKLVWHLNSNSGNQVQDSTLNNFDGNPTGGPIIVDGKIGKSIYIDGIDDQLPTTHFASDLGVNGNAKRTLSVWTKYDGSTSEYGWIFAVGQPGGGCCLYRGFFLIENGDNKISFGVGGEWTQNANWNIKPNGSPNNVWVYYTAVYDGDQKIYVYADGALKADATLGYGEFNSLITSDEKPFGIGAGPYRAKGVFDEMRISVDTHSQDWIMTEYNNQSDPGSFYTVSSQMTGSP